MIFVVITIVWVLKGIKEAIVGAAIVHLFSFEFSVLN